MKKQYYYSQPKSFGDKIKSLVTAAKEKIFGKPVYGAKIFQTRSWLSREVQEEQYKQMKNRVLGIE